MLIRAPDCFINDSPGAPLLLKLLDSLDHGISSLLLPTFVFENPSNYKYINVTAPDIFVVFTQRRCPMLLASRHMPIFDPHDVSVAFVHEELSASGARQHAYHLPPMIVCNRVCMYTAATAVHHYFQLFSTRGSDELQWSEYTGKTVPYCVDGSMVGMGSVVYELLQELARDFRPEI